MRISIKLINFKKELSIIKNDKILILTLPIAILFLFIMKIVKFFLHLRFGLLHSDRIGHFTANTELFLLENKHIISKKKFIDIYYFPRDPCNKFLSDLWKREIIILPKLLIRPLCLISRKFSFFNEFICGKSIGGDVDLLNLYDNYPPVLKFSDKDYKKGYDLLKSILDI
ncbi:hypothetical protein OAC15_05245 [Alphaproteobacteria bacterium]|nr:hypothetical protein [Alphaproteobacteria bacterium]